MLCCIVGAILIVKFVVNYKEIKSFLGFEEKEKTDREGYGYDD